MSSIISVIEDGKIITNAKKKRRLQRFDSYDPRSVYTALRTYLRSKPFQVDEHLERLEEHAQAMGFPITDRLEKIRQWIQKIIGASKRKRDSFLTIIVTPKKTVLLLKSLEIDHTVYRGVCTQTLRKTRMRPQIKTLPDPEIQSEWEKAKSRGKFEVLLVNPLDGVIEEGAKSNILWVKNGILLWTTRGLSGTTEAIIKRLAKELKIPLQEGILLASDLRSVDELMIASSRIGIVPVNRVDDIMMGKNTDHAGSPGPVTLKLTKEFLHFVKHDLMETDEDPCF